MDNTKAVITLKTLLYFWCVLFMSSAQAQLDSLYVSPMLGYAYLDKKGDIDSADTLGLNLGYEVNPLWSLEIGYWVLDTTTTYNDSVDFSSWSIGALYKPVKFNAWQPYLSGGVSAWSFDIDSVAQTSEQETKLGFGGGVLYELSPQFDLRIDAVSSYSVDNQLLDNVFSIGVQWFPMRKSAPVQFLKVKPASNCIHIETIEMARQLNCTHFHEELRTFDLDVLFASNTWKVDEKYILNLEKLANFLKQYPQTHTIVKGFADSSGTEDSNLALSQKRADEVMKLLIKHYQIAPSRLSARGYGEQFPVASNKTTQGRAENRHTHVHATVKTLVEIK